MLDLLYSDLFPLIIKDLSYKDLVSLYSVNKKIYNQLKITKIINEKLKLEISGVFAKLKKKHTLIFNEYDLIEPKNLKIILGSHVKAFKLKIEVRDLNFHSSPTYNIHKCGQDFKFKRNHIAKLIKTLIMKNISYTWYRQKSKVQICSGVTLE